MKLKLFTPASTLNWTLVAEDLQDPDDWSVFLLNHGPGTERYGFEDAVSQASAENNVRLNAYRLRCKRGVCTLEYLWETEPAAVKAHARRVAEILTVDIEIAQRPVNPRLMG